MKKNKILDLFCGVGGLSYGFEKQGYEVILGIDLWEDAIKTYNYNRKNKVGKCLDIHELNEEFLKKLNKNGEIIGIVGGPPCQGFSTVGTRDINDPRNHLYKEYCRIVETIQPEFFVIENVRGMLTLGNGFFKEDIENRFGALGYKISNRILNAKNYGVPQSRERVFFIGLKNIHFNFDDLDVLSEISTEEAIGDLPSLDGKSAEPEKYSYETLSMTPYQELMRLDSEFIYNHNLTKHTEQTVNIISMIKDGGSIRDLPREYWEIRKYNKAFQRMNRKKPSHTVDTGHRNYFHYQENRVPSVRENARLQSFPDNFIFKGSKTSQYKQVGNAVPPILGEVIAKKIKELL